MNASRLLSSAIATLLLAGSLAGAALAQTAIAPGDVIDVSVFGEPALTQQVTVSRDGSITYPLVGRVMIAGKSTNAAGEALASALSRYIRHPIVAIALHTEAQYNVLVLGNVKSPGRYLLQPGARVTDAIAAAGGLGPVNGKLPEARVSVGDNVTSVSLDGLLRRGDLTANLPLANNSGVYVPAPLTIRVRVLGAVDHPGDVEINEGDHLAVAIAKAGNSTNSNADLNNVTLSRKAPDGTVSRTQINLYEALRKGDLTSDPAMMADDQVYVPESRKKTDPLGIFGLLRRLVFPF